MKVFLQVIFICFIVCSFCAEACTGIRMTALDGSTVNGRTVEFGTVIDMHTCVVPRNFPFIGKSSIGNGLSYTSKYAAVGIYCFEDRVLMDGLNEKGLSCGAFYFPGLATYAAINENNQSKAISPVEFPNWVLTQFGTLEEVKAALDSIVIAPTVIKGWGMVPPPFHYIIYDKKGRALVVEPLEGRLVTYDNKIGSFTNSPAFDWHETNLRNFINLTNYNVRPVNLEGLELSAFGQGSGMVGLPGDFTPPSRFVRASIFSATAIPSKDAQGLVGQTFHILNQFDIPLGVARGFEENKPTADYTMLTSLKDPNSMRYYFKTYEDQTIRWIAFQDFDLEAKMLFSASTKGRETSSNAASSLKPI